MQVALFGGNNVAVLATVHVDLRELVAVVAGTEPFVRPVQVAQMLVIFAAAPGKKKKSSYSIQIVVFKRKKLPIVQLQMVAFVPRGR